MDERGRVGVLEDPLARQPPCGARRLRPGQLRLGRDHREVRVVAEHRDGPRHRLHGRGLAAQPGGDVPVDRARPGRGDGGGVLGVRPHPVGDQHPQQFADEQRVAAGDRVAGGAELLVRVRPELLPHQVGDAPRAEVPGAQQREVVGGQEVVDQLVVPVLGGPDRHGHQDPDRVEPPGQETQEPQGRLVGPLGVVHQHGQRRPLGEVDQQPVQAVQQRERRPRSGLPVTGAEQALGDAGGAAEHLPPLLVVARQDGFEQLAHHAEGELPLQFGAAGRQHDAPLVRREPAQVAQQGRLAETGPRLQHREAAVTGLHPDHELPEGAHLGVPFHEPRHRTSALRSVSTLMW